MRLAFSAELPAALRADPGWHSSMFARDCGSAFRQLMQQSAATACRPCPLRGRARSGAVPAQGPPAGPRATPELRLKPTWAGSWARAEESPIQTW